MRKSKLLKKLTAVTLSAAMVLSMSACSKSNGAGTDKKGNPITLTVFSQLANYNGEQVGWFAKEMLDRFNVKLNIIPDSDGTFDTRMESGNLGDIVVFGSAGKQYKAAVEAGALLDWNEDNMLNDCAPYIAENMQAALEKNKQINSDGLVHGIGHGIATSSEDHQDFFYTWDLRWDLYKALDYPEVKSLDDLADLLTSMQALCPTDDKGNYTYGVSLWPDWDGNMVMYVKSMATAWYGYDELHLGLYDSDTGEFHGALEENGPYLEMLKFFNTLYQRGLLDPDSMTQTYNEMIDKVLNGGVFFSIFNYAGSLAYNTEEHIKDDKMMLTMKPEDATPIVYGMDTAGGNRIWSIGSKTEYPELCLEIINWLCTPEGRMVSEYGPEGVTWYYDDEKNTNFTTLGASAIRDVNTVMPDDLGTFGDGRQQINNITWSLDAKNPDSNGETYNWQNWKSNLAEASCSIEQDWRDKTSAVSVQDYLNHHAYKVAPATTYTDGVRSDELEVTWNQVTDCIVKGSWNAIYASTDAEYESIVSKMISDAYEYGYEECIAWNENEAAIRHQLEEEVRAKDAK